MWILTGRSDLFPHQGWYECPDGSRQDELGDGCVWGDLGECEKRKKELESELSEENRRLVCFAIEKI